MEEEDGETAYDGSSSRNLGHMLEVYESGGTLEWQFGMLNDKPRNERYYEALKAAMQEKPEATVLDIGTGSGILAIMALRSGAAHVTACEVTGIMCEKAEEILELNECDSTRYTLINKHSQELKVGPGKDLPCPANVLVSEIVDSGLLGEGIFPTYEHAKAELISPDATIIPCGATIHAMLVECPTVRARNRVFSVAGLDLSDLNSDQPRAIPSVPSVSFPSSVPPLADLPPVSDFYRLACCQYQALSEPFPAHYVDFTRRDNKPLAQSKHVVRIQTGGLCDGVCYWWDLHLSPDPAHTVTTNPSSPDAKTKAHWCQGFQLLGHPMVVDPDQLIALSVGTSDAQILFDLRRAEDLRPGEEVRLTGPIATKPYLPRPRLLQLNDSARVAALSASIHRFVAQLPPDTVCVDAGGGTGLAAMLAARSSGGSHVVVTCESDSRHRKAVQAVLARNLFDLEHMLVADCPPRHAVDWCREHIGAYRSITGLIGEMVDMDLLLAGGSQAGWEDAVLFWNTVQVLLEDLSPDVEDRDDPPSPDDNDLEPSPPPLAILPRGVSVWVVPISSPVLVKRFNTIDADATLGIDVMPMEEFRTSEVAQELELLCPEEFQAVAPPRRVLEFDFLRSMDPVEAVVSFTMAANAELHALLMFFEVQLDSNTSFFTGPCSHTYRQIVQFCREYSFLPAGTVLDVAVRFDGAMFLDLSLLATTPPHLTHDHPPSTLTS